VRSWLAKYDMRSASSLDEALLLLANEPGKWTAFAGGTDIMVLLEAGRLPKRDFLSIWGVPGLRGIVHRPDGIRIGALSTYSDLLADSILQAEFPLLCAAARETGALAIQNRGTIGGNIANASPAADVPPALLVYDAILEVASSRGRRQVEYAGFHTGYKLMDLAPDELIAAVVLPRRRSSWKQVYRKVGTRRAQAISKICFAAAADIRDGFVHDVRIALGSVAPTVIRARSAEAVLRGRGLEPSTIRSARAALGDDISPIDDIRSTAAYRQLVAGNLLEGFLS
jgi:CO/xanthine dehydrogenase FAD-binding subunit